MSFLNKALEQAKQLQQIATEAMQKGYEQAQPLVAQEEPSLDQYAENDRKECVKQWFADAHLTGCCAAQITRQQDRTYSRGAWNHIQGGAAEQENPDSDNRTLRKSELGCCRQHVNLLDHFRDAIKGQKQHR